MHLINLIFCILLGAYNFYRSYTGLHKRPWVDFCLWWKVVEEGFSAFMHFKTWLYFYILYSLESNL